ncbi:MAG TPA: HAMP domain-containing sensor histidine kinase [Streptosporangiaceae bacterium]|nr:HAMP domain-containing sensor histidine kinase [Streptosporangiaceae bacterium]
MKRRSHLSLRARLLAGLIAVTTIFLLVLGLVSTLVLSKRLGSEFDGQLQVDARRPIREIALLPDAYAVFYSQRTHESGQITPTSLVGQKLEFYLNQQVAAMRVSTTPLPEIRQGIRRVPFTLRLPGAPALRAIWRLAESTAEKGQATVPLGAALVLVAKPLSQREAPLRQVILAEVITGVALIALLAVGGRWLIRRGLAPLDEMATTADRITSQGDLTARMPDSGDRAEAGRLSSAINTMLDRIQQAFSARLASEQKVRQFAADASHELRTPLTTIRGYAELYRQGALGPDRLPQAMRRIEQEADRMSKLVAELLELARLNRTSSLDLRETDLAALVRDAVEDAIAVEPDRPVYAEAPAHLAAVVDEPRVRQVLANLLGNVREHTPRGTPTAVRLAQTGQSVLLEVADSGPGMSPEDAARAFDRFHRGSFATPTQPGGVPTETRAADPDRSGSGLGLSIVQAIAAAHGGQATLESVPGRGTRVRVWLPARITAPPPGSNGGPVSPRPAPQPGQSTP